MGRIGARIGAIRRLLLVLGSRQHRGVPDRTPASNSSHPDSASASGCVGVLREHLQIEAERARRVARCLERLGLRQGPVQLGGPAQAHRARGGLAREAGPGLRYHDGDRHRRHDGQRTHHQHGRAAPPCRGRGRAPIRCRVARCRCAVSPSVSGGDVGRRRSSRLFLVPMPAGPRRLAACTRSRRATKSTSEMSPAPRSRSRSSSESRRKESSSSSSAPCHGVGAGLPDRRRRGRDRPGPRAPGRGPRRRPTPRPRCRRRLSTATMPTTATTNAPGGRTHTHAVHPAPGDGGGCRARTDSPGRRRSGCRSAPARTRAATAWRIATAVEAEESATEMPSQLGHRSCASMASARWVAVTGAPPRDAPKPRATATTTTSTTHGHRARPLVLAARTHGWLPWARFSQ